MCDSLAVQNTIMDALRNLSNELKTKHGIDFSIENFGNINIDNSFEIDLDDIQSKQDLKRKPLNELKTICKKFKLRYSGKKDQLVERIWGVKFPDEAPIDSKPKKRGRKSKNSFEDNYDTIDNNSIHNEITPVHSNVSSPIHSNESSPINSPISD